LTAAADAGLACEVTNGQPAVIAVAGAGPRAVGFLERLSANVSELFPDRAVEVHLVDPYPPGAGRVWRDDQSPLLWMNSMAQDVTMFTDDSVRCDGPVVPGPSLAEWAAARGDGITGRTFASRRTASGYLSWFFDHVRETLPPTVRVVVHTDTVTRVTGPADGPQRMWLAHAAEPLVADAAVFALGHLDAENHGPARETADFAARHGLYHLPPAYTADVDLDGIPAGEPVLVRGMGLTFVDVMVLVTEGRGGRYRTAPDGAPTYLPSGREPVLYVGSRRGVPYHAKIGYGLAAGPPPLPRFFGPDVVDELLATHDTVDFDRDVWPLLAKDTGWGYYHELAAARPDRFAMPWADFAARYAGSRWNSEELADLVAAAVPDPADRFDVARLDRPLRGLRFADLAALQRHLRAYIAADLARRNDRTHGADLGAFLALLYGYAQMPRIAASGKLDPRSRLDRLEGWWQGFFNHYASGPPGERLAQLAALSRAGVVRFLGADMWVGQDEDRGVFTAGSASVPDVVTARALVDARLPKATVAHSTSGLLKFLHDNGSGTEETLADRRATGLLVVSGVDGRVVGADGVPHRRRFALGPFTTARTAAAFARPGTNAPAFRYNDAAARAVLRLLAERVGWAAGDVEEDGWQTNWCTFA
jgi:FAD-NAD(P)-binding protein